MTRLLRGALLASAVLAPLALFADDKKPGTNRNEFLTELNGPDGQKRADAVARLDAAKKEEYDLLRLVLEKGDWHLRTTAADVLAKAKDPALVKDMAARLANEKNGAVRQGMVMALARMHDPALVPDLCKALADKDWRVRREAAASLRGTAEKSAVDALLARWKEEKNPLVANYIRRTLEGTTKYFLGPNQAAWAAWWSKSRDTIDLATPDEEAAKKAAAAAKRAEEEGRKLATFTTVSRDVELVHDDAGTGVPVLVLPEYGDSKELMQPFFIDIEKVAKVTYVELPHISKFNNLQSAGGKPYYPIDKLVDAFEDIRKEAKVEKIAILANGINGWIAMRYATRYPKNVIGLVFVCPQSSTEKMKEATDRIMNKARAESDTELLHYAMSRRYDTQRRMDDHEIFHADHGVPVPDGEAESLGRKEFSIHFADQQDSVLAELHPIRLRDLGDCLMPEFKVFSEQPVNVPVLVIAGKRSIVVSDGDSQGVANHYNGLLVNLESSGDYPFVEEPEKFSAVVMQFLTKYLPKTAKKK